jgi:hypothetical protein
VQYFNSSPVADRQKGKSEINCFEDVILLWASAVAPFEKICMGTAAVSLLTLVGAILMLFGS